MKKTKIRILVLVMVVSIISMTFISIGAQQLGFKKTLDVWYNSVKVKYNNSDITNQLQPIIVNGVTYLPLSKVSTTFNKSVDWNDSTKTVIIKDTENDDLEEVEEDLNNDYDEYYNIEFEYELSYKDEKIVVKVLTDKDDWANFSFSDKLILYEEICAEILDQVGDGDIRGFVKDDSSTLTEFYTSFEGDSVQGSNDVGDFEDELNRKLMDGNFGMLEGIDNEDLYIRLSGNDKNMRYYINIYIDDYEDEWDDVDDDNVEYMMGAIYDEIKGDADFGNAEINGYFYNVDDDDEKILVKCKNVSNKKEYDYYD